MLGMEVILNGGWNASPAYLACPPHPDPSHCRATANGSAVRRLRAASNAEDRYDKYHGGMEASSVQEVDLTRTKERLRVSFKGLDQGYDMDNEYNFLKANSTWNLERSTPRPLPWLFHPPSRARSRRRSERKASIPPQSPNAIPNPAPSSVPPLNPPTNPSPPLAFPAPSFFGTRQSPGHLYPVGEADGDRRVRRVGGPGSRGW